MRTACPNCNAPVEFRYDDSFVRICDHCRNAILRSDRGIETLGRVADLVPMESPLALFADGRYGKTTFLLIGMAQIRHDGGGMWQEWYAKLDDRWGWLAEAQGRFYLTFEFNHANVPPRGTLGPGSTIELPVDGQGKMFTVGELGRARYVAASGELPYRLVPEGTFDFVDLSDGAGMFATIDYGEPGDTPTLYIGKQVTLADLGMRGGEVGPPRDAPIASKRLACPNCNAPIEISAPGQSLRVACAHCNHLLDVNDGALAVLKKLKERASPAIPLGTKGTFADGEMKVIGFVQRSAHVDGEWYPFYEYLLFSQAVGFRWLVDSDSHWSYVQPVATGAVEPDAGIGGVKYDGVRFRSFQNATLRVDVVVGEFYWRVEAGEQCRAEDYVAPPAMLSLESSGKEANWSLATYLTPKQVRAAFGNVELPTIGAPIGRAPNQPNKYRFATLWITLLFVALCTLGISFASCAKGKHVHTMKFTVPGTTTKTTSSTTTPAPSRPSLRPTAPPVAASDPCGDVKRFVDALPRCTKMTASDRAYITRRAKPLAGYDPTSATAKRLCTNELGLIKPKMQSMCPDVLAKVSPPAAPTTSATSTTGVAECDEIIALYKQLFECDVFKRMPADTQATQRESVRTMTQSWHFTTDAEKAAARTQCSAGRDGLVQGAKQVGCELSTAAIGSGSGAGSSSVESAGSAGSADSVGSAGSAAGSAAPPADQGHVEFSDKFQIDGKHNIEIEITAPTLSNNWAYVVVDLVDESTGRVIDLEAGIEYYSGYDSGDSWTEGSRSKSDVISPQPTGEYVLRTESQIGGTTDTPIVVEVKQGIFRARYFWIAFGCFCAPFLLLLGLSYAFERSRWWNSNVSPPKFTGADVWKVIKVVLIIAVCIAAVVLMVMLDDD